MSGKSIEGANGISLVDINREMRESYLQYSMSVIVGRALPDARDGLKPVHRRILFAMKDLSNTFDKPYKKSARVVGDVIGKYHPHGEMAVYDAIVRMAQDFSMQAPLIDGQGNFGSIDGDSAAAPRYTEIRMTRLAGELLRDIEKETVPFGPNYDETLFIPQVLPARYPNLLVNGSEGIAVGMASKIPPHNLSEVTEACLFLLDRPEADILELIEKVPGPDFPTAGVIEGREAIRSAYMKGRGVITLSAVTEIDEGGKGPPRILVTELPYQVNKARLIESIAQLAKDKLVEGISDIRDESSREGMRIVIQLKRGASPQVLLNQLQKRSQLKTSFGIIFLALDKRNQPKIFNLKQMLLVFIEHRKNVIARRLIFDLRKAQEKLHILEGLKKALDQIDEVIALIRRSPSAADARRGLISDLKFSHRQAKAILEMRLQKLTGMERKTLEKDREETARLAAHLEDLLSSEKKIEGLLRGELEEIKAAYGRPRRTRIVEAEGEITDRDLIPEEDVVVFLTFKGLVKRIPLQEYRLQRRGGKGLKGWEFRTEGDFVWKVWGAGSRDRMMVFSSAGRLHWMDVFRIPSGSRLAKARSLKNLLQLREGEEARAVLPLRDLSEGASVGMITKKGILKRSLLKLFARPRSGGVTALSIDRGDELQDVQLGQGNGDFLIFTRRGKAIRFKEGDIRSTGRASRGVRGLRLKKGDFVVSMEIVPRQPAPGSESADLEDSAARADEGSQAPAPSKLGAGGPEILVVTEKGFGKRVRVSQFRVQRRGGGGVLGQKITERTGDVVYARMVTPGQQALITTNQGQAIRFALSDISVVGRVSQGVRLIKLKKGEKVTGAALVDDDDSAPSHGSPSNNDSESGLGSGAGADNKASSGSGAENISGSHESGPSGGSS